MQHCSIKKILVMVSLTLSIICSVFYLCKKVGLCEEPEVISYNPPPFIYGHGICNGGATQETLLYVLDNAITRYTKYVIGDPVIVLWSNDNFWVIFLNCTDNIYTHSKPSDFSSGTFKFTSKKYYCYYNRNYVASGGAADFSFKLSDIQDNGNYLTGSYVDGYPLYVYHPENILFSEDNTQIFAPDVVPVGPSGHTKGGVIANYISSLDEDEEPPNG